jgi:hypothetical protein
MIASSTMPEPRLRVVCFSKDRPLQLHGYLSSLLREVDDPGALSVFVLIAQPCGTTCPTRGQEILKAYGDVLGEFPQVTFVPQTDFTVNVAALVDSGIPWTMFGVDDAVYHHRFSPARVTGLLEQREDLIGVSLRLGVNIRASMFFPNAVIPQPPLDTCDEFVLWQVEEAGYDWGYPWELCGTVYPTSLVQAMLREIGDTAQTPNQLEALGAQRWLGVIPQRGMAAYTTSRLVVPTVNVVQHDFPNHPPGVLHSTEQLLDAWLDGWRIHPAPLNRDFASIHIGDLPLWRFDAS